MRDDYYTEQTSVRHIAGAIGCLAASLLSVVLVLVGIGTVIAFLKEVLG